MFLNNPFPGAFGLDIGDLSIKLIQLEPPSIFSRPALPRLGEIRTISLAPGLIVNGEIQQPELVRKKILHLLEASATHKRITSPWVVADLPEPKTFLKLIEIDTPVDELVYDDIAFQARRHLPFELEETYLDWHVADSPLYGKTKSRVLIGAVPKVVADAYTYLLEAAGLKPIALEIEAVALARTLLTRAKDYTGMGRVLLDVGATRSSLIIYDHESIQLSTSLNFSGELVTTAISQGLKISHDEAEDLKLKVGLAHHPKIPSYLTIVAGLIAGLENEIKKTLSFYHEHFPNPNPITHITMCGGMANCLNLDTVLSQKLKISTHPGHVWKNLIASTDSDFDKKGLALASAIGLALRAVENPLTM